MKVGVILIHYHAAELTKRCVEAVERDLAEAGVDAELVVVDNGSTPDEREHLARLATRGSTRLLEPGGNLGYAGGINHGVGELGIDRLDAIFLLNPDVELLPGASAALLKALNDGAGVAGPRFYWDPERRFLLPPTEQRTFFTELLAILARRGDPWAAPGRRRWRGHARRVWTATQPISSYELSGAMLAIRRDAWERVGPFDAGYPLYFEETDWLERARRLGVASRYVPTAEAIHLYAQSTSREPRAEAWFVQSSRRFRRRHYGPVRTFLLERFSRLWGERRATEVLRAAVQPAPVIDLGDLWWEVAESAAGYPAAASRPGVDIEPDALPEGLVLRGVTEDGRELAAPRLIPPRRDPSSPSAG